MNGLDVVVSIRYMIAGYAVICALIAVYLASLILRWRNLKRNLQSLDEMK